MRFWIILIASVLNIGVYYITQDHFAFFLACFNWLLASYYCYEDEYKEIKK